MSVPDAAALHERVAAWYATAARDLPWRRAGATAWGVLVSEVMLQQTPVARVLPVYDMWMHRWPEPRHLAAEAVGEAVRAWGRLGYPRRALRLHAAACAITAEHGGRVPDSYPELRALPGVGDYTAAAVLSFAYGARHVVLDTNVRRVLTRVAGGQEYPAAAVTAAERRTAERLMPPGAAAAPWAAATMELGALVCTARNPACDRCPVLQLCQWQAAGRPAGRRARPQATYEGSDRQARGRMLELLRSSPAPLGPALLLAVCADEEQARRSLAGLTMDGLVQEVHLPGDGVAFCLPGDVSAGGRPPWSA